MKFSTLVQKLETVGHTSLTINPHLDPEISGVSAIDAAESGTLSYVDGIKYAAQVATSPASALILPIDEPLQAQASAQDRAWITSPYPRLTFAEAIALFYQPFQPEPEIHPTAVIHPTAQIGQGVAIGAHVVIQTNVVIGDRVCIHPNVVIYPDAQIGDRTVLHANCVIHERTHIGAHCVIHSGAAIGSEGFGFVPVPDGWVKMQQSGHVVLEEGVEVGCNAAIDRPSVGETRIGRNTKIDNLVHVAHGCQIDENCALAAQVGLAGKVTLGNRVILAGQVGISDGVTLGNGAIATAQTGIHRDVPANEVVSGYPAIPNRLWLKASAIYNRLPEIYQTLRQLKKSITLNR